MTITSSPTPAVTVPPHNLDAERSVLGAVLLTPVWLNTIVLDVGLTGEDFYRPWHGHVFTAMCTLADAGEPIDHLTVAEVMRGRGQLGDDLEPTAVEQLLSWVPPPRMASNTPRSFATTHSYAGCWPPPTRSKRWLPPTATRSLT